MIKKMANMVISTLLLLAIFTPFEHLAEARNKKKADVVRSSRVKEINLRKFQYQENGSSSETVDDKSTLDHSKATRKDPEKKRTKTKENVKENGPRQRKKLRKESQNSHRSLAQPLKVNRRVLQNWTENDLDLNLEAFRRYMKMKLEIEEIKQEKVPRHVKLPHLFDLDDIQADDGGRVSQVGFHAEPKKGYVRATDIFANCSDTLDYACLGFESLKQKKNYYIKAARLWLRGVSKSKIKLKLYSLKKTRSIQNKSIKILEEGHFLAHFSISGERMGLDVTKVVKKWIDKPKYNHGFGLVVKIKDERSILEDRPDLFVNKKFAPFLELELLPIRKVERNPVCTPDETRCCRKVVKIKAHDIFHQIIAPDEFELTFCSGSCDDPTMSFVNNYTRRIQSFRWRTEAESLRSSLSLCCAPIAFRAQSILLYKEGNIIKYDIPDLIPTACGCI